MAFADSIRTNYATMSGVATLLEYLQTGTPFWCGTSSGTNTITATATPTPASYVAGACYRFIAGGTNTGATTINISSLGAKNVRCYDNTVPMVGYEIRAGQIVDVVYDGTQFILLTPAFQTFKDWTPTFSASGSMTISSTSITYAQYNVLGGMVFFQVFASFTTGGTTNNEVRFTLPLTAANTSYTFACTANDGTDGAGAGSANSTTVAAVRKYNAANWTLAAGCTLRASGFYRVGA